MRSLCLLFLLLCLFGCKKLLELKEQDNVLLPTEVFATDSGANGALAGIYLSTGVLHKNYISLSIAQGLAADELSTRSADERLKEYERNSIQSSNRHLRWDVLYKIIYDCNSALEQLRISNTLSDTSKTYHQGEAHFLRAYSYFILVNLFGDVPLLLTTDVEKNAIASRTSSAEVYEQIHADLLEAERLLSQDITLANDKRRASGWAAAAMLSRYYLTRGEWQRAADKAAQVIESKKYTLSESLDGVFLRASEEAIWQMGDGSTGNLEAVTLIVTGAPSVFFTASFLASFEPGDQRRIHWIGLNSFSGTDYFFPFKYKIPTINSIEAYLVLRLAEQHLIRAEAQAHLGKTSLALEDLNIIRVRAGLPKITGNVDSDSCIKLVLQERRVELFAETGHRWFDLKRTKNVDAVLSALKGDLWQPTDSVLPIPANDIQRNVNLDQNPGY